MLAVSGLLKRQRVQTDSPWSTRLPAVLLREVFSLLNGCDLALASCTCKLWRLNDRVRQLLFKTCYLRNSAACLPYDTRDLTPDWQRLFARRIQTDRNWRRGRFRSYVVDPPCRSYDAIPVPGGFMTFLPQENALVIYSGDTKTLISQRAGITSDDFLCHVVRADPFSSPPLVFVALSQSWRQCCAVRAYTLPSLELSHEIKFAVTLDERLSQTAYGCLFFYSFSTRNYVVRDAMTGTVRYSLNTSDHPFVPLSDTTVASTLSSWRPMRIFRSGQLVQELTKPAPTAHLVGTSDGGLLASDARSGNHLLIWQPGQIDIIMVPLQGCFEATLILRQPARDIVLAQSIHSPTVLALNLAGNELFRAQGSNSIVYATPNEVVCTSCDSMKWRVLDFKPEI